MIVLRARATLAVLLIAAASAAACREGGVVAQQRVLGGDAARGRDAFVTYGCGSCHVIPGVPAAEGLVGPPLTDFADRTYVAGHLRNEPVGLVRWIRDPQTIDPGTAMPDLGVSEQEARDMAAYLYTLHADRLGPPHPVPQRVLPRH